MHVRPAFKEDKEPVVYVQPVEKSSFKKEKKVDLLKNL